MTTPSGQRPTAPPSLSILIVDDEPALRNMVARALEFGGHRSLQANDGDEALILLTAVKPAIQLVLTDLRMPGLDGAGLGRAVHERFPDVGIMYMSAYGHDDVDLPHSDAMPLFLGKPFTTDELLEAVNQAAHRLERRDMQRR